MTANTVLYRPTVRETISPGGEYLRDRGANHRPRFHQGVDVQVGVGTPVYAAGTGTVIETGNTGRTSGHGLYCRIRYEAAGTTVVVTYSHLSVLDVNRNERVTAHTLVGLSGGAKGSFGAGGSGGPHLHMETRVAGALVDPYEWLVSRTGTAGDITPISPEEDPMYKLIKGDGDTVTMVGLGWQHVAGSDFKAASWLWGEVHQLSEQDYRAQIALAEMRAMDIVNALAKTATGPSAAQIAAELATIIPKPTGTVTIDYAALAKAVNDDASRRMQA